MAVVLHPRNANIVELFPPQPLSSRRKRRAWSFWFSNLMPKCMSGWLWLWWCECEAVVSMVPHG